MSEQTKSTHVARSFKLLSTGLLASTWAVGCGGGGAAPVAAATPAGSVAQATTAKVGAPAELLDLTNWKLTLPVGQTHDPDEIRQPELKTFSNEKYFFLTEEGVVFRANSGGVTTPHSRYPRTELREMASDGEEQASWSTEKGRHTMSYSAAITHLPVAKPHVVVGQILEPEDDVLMVRLERKHLFVEGGGNNLGTLERDYELGTFFNIIIDASEGRVRVYYNDEKTPRVDVERAFDGCYFKIGSYIQSSIELGDSRDAYGEVIVKAMAVEHSE